MNTTSVFVNTTSVQDYGMNGGVTALIVLGALFLAWVGCALCCKCAKEQTCCCAPDFCSFHAPPSPEPPKIVVHSEKPVDNNSQAIGL
jgi:hypothetical protein